MADAQKILPGFQRNRGFCTSKELRYLIGDSRGVEVLNRRFQRNRGSESDLEDSRLGVLMHVLHKMWIVHVARIEISGRIVRIRIKKGPSQHLQYFVLWCW